MFAMSLIVLLLLFVLVGYNTIIGFENVNSYHVETDFKPLDSIINSKHQLCNATYSEKNVTRQLATGSNITGPFTIICNISDNIKSTNDMQLQTCLDVFTDIEIKFACYDYHNKTYENFTVSYPYDNGTLDVIHNCSSPIIVEMKPLYQSSYANWSNCENISKNALPNCSVACIKNICSINTRCINEIDPRCLIPKYMDMYIRMIYECVHHSKVYPERTEDDLFHVNIGCGNGWIINISDVSLQQIKYACPKYEYPNECLISGEDKSRIIYECSNKNNCSMSIKLNITCDNVKSYAFYNVSYKCSKSNNNTKIGINVSACQMVNETTHIQCDNGKSIIESLSINFQPAHVASCLQEHNISWDYENVCRKQNKSKCDINLFKGMLLHQCLVVPKREIVITYSCVEDFRGEVSIQPPFLSPNNDFTTHTVFNSSLTTSKEGITKTKSVPIGPIIGGTIGSITLAAVFVVLFCCFRRVNILKNKSHEQSTSMIGSLIRQNSLKDYTGVQMVAYPDASNEYMSDSNVTNDMITEVSADPRNKFESKHKENSKGKEKDVVNNNSVSRYSLAKPIADKSQLPNMQHGMTETDSGYSMVKRISKENFTQSMPDLVTSNDYEDSPEGVYDQSKRRRNMNDADVYDRATDGTYDTANHCAKLRTESDDIAYDHFTGPKSNDNYELVMRHNKVAIDDTYGVH